MAGDDSDSDENSDSDEDENSVSGDDKRALVLSCTIMNFNFKT
jgi:hypothetical protein